MTVAVAGAVMGRPSSAALTDRLDRARLRNVVLTDELTARKAEAVDLADYLLPLVAFLTNAARAVGPREYQAALAVAYRPFQRQGWLNVSGRFRRWHSTCAS